jgi:hypothetical protein
VIWINKCHCDQRRPHLELRNLIFSQPKLLQVD